MNVIVTQNNSATEQVGSAVIEKLYQLATNGLDSSSNLVGRLHTTATYREYINMLTERFKDLYITADKYYIWFQDPVVRQKLLTITGDGIGISTDEAATAEIGTLFREDTNITSFNELKYFTRFCKNPSSYAFYKCSNLTSVDLSNVETLSQSEFEQTGLSGEISIPLLNTVGPGALRSTNITKITNLGTITQIPEAFCYGCQNLTEVTIPESCTRLANYVFGMCSNLTTVNNLQQITSFGDFCFQRCSSLNLTLQDIQNATTIGPNAFDGVSALSGTLNLPNLTGTLGGASFKDTQISSISSLGSVTGIGDLAFSNTNISSISIPNSVKICSCDIVSNTNVQEIIFPEGVEEITGGQFYTKNNSLTYIEIPSTVTNMGLFFHRSLENSQDNLCTVVIKATTPPTLNYYASWSVDDTRGDKFAGIYVPDASLTAYQNGANAWQHSSIQAKLKPISQLQTDNPTAWAKYNRASTV